MPFYVAKVVLLFDADNETEAADACAEILRAQCEDFAPGSALVTWSMASDIEPTTFDRGEYPVGASYDAVVPGAE